MHALRFATLLLAALGLVMGGAHVLELVPKLHYDAEMYANVTSTLYRCFGSVGAGIQVAALASACILTLRVRGRPSFRLTLIGTLGLAASLALWGVLVAPVNAEWLRVLEESPASVPDAYLRLRPRWEAGHAAAFAAWLGGFALLLASLLAEVPNDRGRGA